MSRQLENTNPFSEFTNPFLPYYETSPSVTQNTNPFLQSTVPIGAVADPLPNDSILSTQEFLDRCYNKYVLAETSSNFVVEPPVLFPTFTLPGQSNTPPIPPRIHENIPRTGPLHSTAAFETDRQVHYPALLESSESLHSSFQDKSIVSDSDSIVNAGNSTNQLLKTLVEQFTSTIREVNAKNNTTVTTTPSTKLKLPKFDGKGDVHLFIKQFVQVAKLNRWDDQVTVLQLRSCLEHGAKNCGQADSIGEIFDCLIAMYGISASEARERLHTLRRMPEESYPMLGNRVERLARLAYGGLGPQVEKQMALEHFDRALGDSGLRSHILVVRPKTLSEAVHAAEQYALVNRAPIRPRACERLAHVESEHSFPKMADSGLLELSKSINDRLGEHINLIREQNDRISSLERRPVPRPDAQYGMRRQRACYECGDPSHFIRDCPNKRPRQRRETRDVNPPMAEN